jgi:hypothetical protein
MDAELAKLGDSIYELAFSLDRFSAVLEKLIPEPDGEQENEFEPAEE